MNALVTVIIPNYNHYNYLEERISSVLHQTYDNYEVIILDDCSTDDSLEIIEKYRSHPNVKAIVENEQNSGSTFVQWQKGIAMAQGEYIWIAESDDYAAPEFLEQIMDMMNEDKGIVLGFTAITWVNEHSEIIGDCPLVTYARRPVSDGGYFIRHNMLYGCHILNASSAVFRKDAALRVPDAYMNFKGAGDYLFWIEIARQGKVLKINRNLDYFRIHSAKVTSNAVATGQQFIEVKKIYDRLKELGYINHFHAWTVPGFWLHRINVERNNFKTADVEPMVRKIWSNEVAFPRIALLLYRFDGLCRLIYKKLFCKHGR